MERVSLDAQWELNDRLFSENDMYVFVETTATERNLLQTMDALKIMKEKHKGQFRKGKDKVPYINHPLLMACHAFALGISEDDILATVLLHDVVEDCDVTVEELEFSDTVKKAVALLSFSTAGKTKEKAKELYFQKISDNRIACIVKLLDRCNNISTMATGFNTTKMISYIKETEKYIYPLAKDVKDKYKEFMGAAFILEYHIKSVIETIKRTLNITMV